MAGESKNPIGTGKSVANPDKKEYPNIPYGPSDFHNTCTIADYQNADNV